MIELETLPVEKFVPAAPVAAVRISILLVDDEGRNLDVLESILASPELRLVRAQTPEDALLALVHDEFACIVMDIQMPGMSGLELSRLIKTRKRSQHIPIIFLTAYFLEEKDILQGYGAGAVDYLTKPLNAQILKSKVGVFVDLFRTTHALAAANLALEQEISQRKNAEEALRRANSELEERVESRTAELALTEKRYREVVHGLPAAVYVCDVQGCITLYNEAAVELWGREPRPQDRWCGSHKIFRPDGQKIDLSECPMAVAIRENRALRGEELIVESPRGLRRHIQQFPQPLHDAGGKLIGAVNMLLDITERKRAEQELKNTNEELLAASRAKDHFLATLSHELRTPLNPILLLASEAVSDPDLSPQTRANFELIHKNVELEARLIDDLLDLTRITRGKILLDKHFLDAHTILRDAIANVQEDINQKNITLELNFAAPAAHVFADMVRLQQVFWNLLKNAVKFTSQHGRIVVETKIQNENQIAIRISDTGIGIAEDEMGAIFNAFSQGDHAQRFGGLGLGLAISKRLVEFHDGKISAHSAGRNQGATFRVELPLAKTSPQNNSVNGHDVHSTAPAADAAPKNVRILLVEDHEPTRTTLAQLLTRRRFEVVTAASVTEALALPQNFQVLISDIGLPDGNGYDLMIEMRKRGCAQGIALTGFGMEQDVARSQEAGFFMHLTKPIRIQSLETALNAALKISPQNFLNLPAQ